MIEGKEAMENIVELKGLKKNYGKKKAVCGIDLTLKKGEIFCLLGPNGAGKSSTLKMLVGLLQPTEGSISICGHDLHKKTAEAKQSMSFVPDLPYVYEKLTPWELLRFIGKLYDMPPNLIQERSEEYLNFFSLGEVQDVLIEEFSHGMRQKTILAAALLHEPKLFVLDEPLVGLDPVSIRDFKDLLKKKAGEGMTILFSTHALHLAEELAERIGIIFNGKMVALGSLEELRKEYQSEESLEQMFMDLIQKQVIENK